MAQLFGAAPANSLPALPNYNICPTDAVHVVRANGEGRALVAMRWGFVPAWYKTLTDGPLLINARAETIADKPAFGAAARARRCIVPVSGYYEWATEDGEKLPWYYHRKDGAPLALAGIWQQWQAGDTALASCALVTTAANALASKVHHRMPVILAPDAWGKWLGEAGKGAARLMQPAPEDVLCAYRVGVAVNSNRAAGCELIEPWEDDEGA